MKGMVELEETVRYCSWLLLLVWLRWLLLNDPQSFLVQGLLVVAAFVLLAALLTRWVKLSMHVAFAALTATFFGCSVPRSRDAVGSFSLTFAV